MIDNKHSTDEGRDHATDDRSPHAHGRYGVWDIVHYRANRVVVRSFAEWCAVYDILLGAAILIPV